MDKRLEYKLKSTSMLIVKLLTKIDFVGFELHYLLLFTSYRSSVSVCLSMCLSGIYIFDDSSLNLDAIGQLCPRDKYRHGPRMGTKIGRDLGCNTYVHGSVKICRELDFLWQHRDPFASL